MGDASWATSLLTRKLARTLITGMVVLTLSIQYLRDLMTFFGVRFKVQAPKSSEESTHSPGEVVVSCVGVGFSNVNKSMA